MIFCIVSNILLQLTHQNTFIILIQLILLVILEFRTNSHSFTLTSEVDHIKNMIYNINETIIKTFMVEIKIYLLQQSNEKLKKLTFFLYSSYILILSSSICFVISGINMYHSSSFIVLLH